MNFEISPRIEDYRARIAEFVAREILPLEDDPDAFDAHGNIALDRLGPLREKARAAGLWCLQLKEETGGAGLGKVGMAVCYEEMSRSIFGPVVFNAAPPDDGNMMLLEAVGTPEQKARWLAPVVAGEVRSAFAMTEPHPGSGSDPSMMLTRAERCGDTYVVRGRKWFITGAEAASHFILIARTSDDPRHGLTAFLFHGDQPGWRIERRIPILGPEEHGGHCELVFDGLEIPAENILLGEGRGLKVAQMRLGPARLTHCMRWLGLARRAHDTALDRAEQRELFGEPMHRLGLAQSLISASVIDIETSDAIITKTAQLLVSDPKAGSAMSSIAKVHCSEAIYRVIDRSVQICGGDGVSDGLPLAQYLAEVRPFRIYDGSTETHLWAISRRASSARRREVEAGAPFLATPTRHPEPGADTGAGA